MKLGLVTDSLAAYPLEQAAAICRKLGLEQVELPASVREIGGSTVERRTFEGTVSGRRRFGRGQCQTGA